MKSNGRTVNIAKGGKCGYRKAFRSTDSPWTGLATSGPEKVITLNQDDYLYIYDQTDKPLSKVAIFGGSNELIWKSEDVYGGSNTYIDPLSGATEDTLPKMNSRAPISISES